MNSSGYAIIKLQEHSSSMIQLPNICTRCSITIRTTFPKYTWANTSSFIPHLMHGLHQTMYLSRHCTAHLITGDWKLLDIKPSIPRVNCMYFLFVWWIKTSSANLKGMYRWKYWCPTYMPVYQLPSKVLNHIQFIHHHCRKIFNIGVDTKAGDSFLSRSSWHKSKSNTSDFRNQK